MVLGIFGWTEVHFSALNFSLTTFNYEGKLLPFVHPVMGHHDRDMSNEIVGFRTVFSYLFISAAYLRMECNRNISVHDDAQRPDSKEISKSTVELLFLIFVGDVYY